MWIIQRLVTGFLAGALERSGIEIGERRAWRLCSQQKLWSTTVKEGSKGRRSCPPGNGDLLSRDFATAQQNRKWVTEVIEHPTHESKGYYCAMKDVFSNRIVGLEVSDRMTADLAVAALRPLSLDANLTVLSSFIPIEDRI